MSGKRCIPFVPFMRAGHDWEYLGDPGELDGRGVCTNGLRYQCQGCGKTKHRYY